MFGSSVSSASGSVGSSARTGVSSASAVPVSVADTSASSVEAASGVDASVASAGCRRASESSPHSGFIKVMGSSPTETSGPNPF